MELAGAKRLVNLPTCSHSSDLDRRCRTIDVLSRRWSLHLAVRDLLVEGQAEVQTLAGGFARRRAVERRRVPKDWRTRTRRSVSDWLGL